MAMRWRKEPNRKGLARVCQGTRGYELREGDEILVHVSTKGKWDTGAWYWYGNINGNHANTCDTPQSLEDAKRDAYAWAKAQKKKET